MQFKNGSKILITNHSHVFPNSNCFLSLFFSVSGFLDKGLCSDSCFAFLEGECGEVEIEKALNQYLGTSPELQCIVSTMSSINDWKVLAIKKTTLVEILQEFSSIGIQAISNFEETQTLVKIIFLYIV
mgnify:FL=1